jgi:ankyrin repeat protein
MMRNHLKFIFYLVLWICFSAANAGSYDDFFIAIKRDDPRTVQNLLQRGFDPNTVDPAGTHGLYLALREPALKVAEVLIDWPKTQIEWRTPEDESPLMMAALKGHTALARKLIARGADVNKTGWTPLHYAATHGHLAIMQMLLDEHAYIDAESPNGTTPLMMAAHYGTPEAVKLLLEAGADPSLKNQLGLTAIDFANRGNRKDAAELVAKAIRDQRPKGKW